MDKGLKKINILTGVFLLISYIWIAVFGLLQISFTQMSHGAHPCPFIAGEQSVCPMDAISHVKKWQTFTMAIILVIKIFIFACFAIALFLIFSFYKYYPLFTRQKQESIPIPLYQLLFSDGILHPRAP